ncbi:MAG: 30S ribosomal protein S20, partial [Anaerohalosphaera sp.]|nr:30S ribosomal protein S20 [Anaerohalosphaera sp.]
SLSAKKRVRQNAKSNQINRARKSVVKTQVKRFEEALKGGDVSVAEQEYVLVTKKLDKMASTSTMHKNTASRTKSRLAKRLNSFKAKMA